MDSDVIGVDTDSLIQDQHITTQEMTLSCPHVQDKPRFAKCTLLVLPLCLFVACMAIYDESFRVDQDSRTPYVLAGIPSSFDLRVLPTYRQIEFASNEQGICLGGGWAQTLAQTLSDYYSARNQKTLKLSAQELLECSVPNQDDICHFTTDSQIQYALSYIANTGLATQSCYPLKLLTYPSQCSRVCTADNSTIDVRYKGVVTEVNKDLNSISNWIALNGPLLMVIQRHDGFNYYSSGILNNSGSNFGLQVLEVVGWKEKGNVLVARSNFGPTWGINGYVQVATSDKTIKKLYGLGFPPIAES